MSVINMAQESISASSKYWDNKTITLTEDTKRKILKKGYTLDAETLFAQYQLEGEDAVAAAKQNEITEEQLIENPNSYTFLGFSAINDLETNASKESRVNAVINLTKLGYTNVYESNTRNFINPPSEAPEEKPEPQPEEETRYQYLKRTRPVQQVEPPPVEQEVYTEPEPSAREKIVSAARAIPNTVRQHLPMRGPAPVRQSMQTNSYVHVNPKLVAQRRQVQQRTNQPIQSRAPVQPRSLINREVALKLGGARINPVAPARRFSPTSEKKVRVSPRFGLGVRK